MEFTGERFVPSLAGQIAYEHLHRYASVREMCAGLRVLDIASGEGFGSAMLAEVAASVVGVDIDEATIEHASRAYAKDNLHFAVGRATAIPAADASLDVVISFETLEHFAEHDAYLAEVKRVLVPGGFFVVSSPNKLVYSDIPNFRNEYHVRELYYDQMRALCDANFHTVRIYGQQIVSVSLMHPIGNGSEPLRWFVRDRPELTSQMPEIADPTYFIALCSDAETLPELTSSFIDPRDALMYDVHRAGDAARQRVAELEAQLHDLLVARDPAARR